MVSVTPSRVTKRSEDGSKEVSISREKNGENADIFISPRFKSAAALAGWDEEDLIIASFVVDDTPERSSSKRRRLSNLLIKSTSPSSRRKQRVKQSLVSLPVVDLEEVIRREEDKSAEKKEKKRQMEKEKQKEKKIVEDEKILLPEQNSNSVVLPCIDKLRDELSCAICLEICFEPSTTTCGHSFCKKCLRSAADKCGRKCPKCRQLIGNARYCTINTVLWNTIQLLFPKEVEAQRAASVNLRGKETPTPRSPNQRVRSRETASVQERRLQTEDLSRLLVSEERSERSERRRRGASIRLDQARDAALALRLQRQEFASAFGVTRAQAASSSSSAASLSLARTNLRAMASRAVRRQG